MYIDLDVDALLFDHLSASQPSIPETVDRDMILEGNAKL